MPGTPDAASRRKKRRKPTDAARITAARKSSGRHSTLGGTDAGTQKRNEAPAMTSSSADGAGTIPGRPNFGAVIDGAMSSYHAQSGPMLVTALSPVREVIDALANEIIRLHQVCIENGIDPTADRGNGSTPAPAPAKRRPARSGSSSSLNLMNT